MTQAEFRTSGRLKKCGVSVAMPFGDSLKVQQLKRLWLHQMRRNAFKIIGIAPAPSTTPLMYFSPTILNGWGSICLRQAETPINGVL